MLVCKGEKFINYLGEEVNEGLSSLLTTQCTIKLYSCISMLSKINIIDMK